MNIHTRERQIKEFKKSVFKHNNKNGRYLNKIKNLN